VCWRTVCYRSGYLGQNRDRFDGIEGDLHAAGSIIARCRQFLVPRAFAVLVAAVSFGFYGNAGGIGDLPGAEALPDAILSEDGK
jgi:hypothetical protein